MSGAGPRIRPMFLQAFASSMCRREVGRRCGVLLMPSSPPQSETRSWRGPCSESRCTQLWDAFGARPCAGLGRVPSHDVLSLEGVPSQAMFRAGTCSQQCSSLRGVPGQASHATVAFNFGPGFDPWLETWVGCPELCRSLGWLANFPCLSWGHVCIIVPCAVRQPATAAAG